jgi:hypothetical protein
MTTKHNCKHPLRGRSHYAARLAARGLSKSPRLEELEVLERRQIRREIETGAPWFVAFTDSAAVVVKDAEPNPKAEALLRDIFGASVPDEDVIWDETSHGYVYAPLTDNNRFGGYEGI